MMMDLLKHWHIIKIKNFRLLELTKW